jgi:uncharacterized protein
MEEGLLDLDLLGLLSGQAHSDERRFAPADPVVGGEPFPIQGREVPTRIDVSKTTGGYALRLAAEVTIEGPCARCLEPAELDLRIEAREVDQPGADDSELSSPYVEDGILDAGAWLRDAITLALPDKVLCRPDCAGICPECGANLNEAGPEHGHERAPDPRFAKLRELQGDD